MTNASDILNRGKHFGAHICVNSNHYYYITFSRKDEFCEHYFSINTNLLKLLKHCNEDWHLLLISNGKVHTFDAKAIVENAQLFNETTYKVPLSAESSNVNADFRYAYKKSECIIDFTFLGNVRYSKKFDMHKKRIYIELNGKRVEYNSVESAWAELSFHFKDKNGKWQLGKGRNADDVQAYRKSFTSFKNDLRKKSIEIYISENKALPANIDYVADNSDTACKAVRSLLVVDQNTTNRDQTETVWENCNNGNVGGQRRLDKELNIIADKLVEKETTKYTSAEIQRTVVSFGSNENMLAAYTLGLTDKGLYKEAAYAAKVFNALNNIDFD